MRPRHGAAVLLAVAIVAGCEVLVDGELRAVHCVDEGAIGPPACPPGSACVEGLCAPLAAMARRLGSPCGADADCAAGELCLDPSSFGGVGARTCSRPCCGSGDCDGPDGAPDVVCWIAPAGGAAFCRPAVLVVRDAPGAAVAGAPCAAGSACRSGACVAGRCADACCSDAGCAASGGACRLAATPLAPVEHWACAAPSSARAPLEPCALDAECASGLCAPMAGVTRCAAPCCGSSTCGALPDGSPIACVELERGGAVVRACALVRPKSATLGLGHACTADDECASGVCLASPGGGYCSDVCCTDASCGDAALLCRPAEAPDGGSAPRAMRCRMK